MPGGDYARRRIIYQDISATADFAATDSNLTVVPGRSSHTTFVQRIVVTIKTSAAQNILFEDSNSAKLYVAEIGASPGTDSRWDFDFGPEGKALTSGKDLLMDMTAGNAGHYEILAYRKLDNATAVGNT